MLTFSTFSIAHLKVWYGERGIDSMSFLLKTMSCKCFHHQVGFPDPLLKFSILNILITRGVKVSRIQSCRSENSRKTQSSGWKVIRASLVSEEIGGLSRYQWMHKPGPHWIFLAKLLQQVLILEIENRQMAFIWTILAKLKEEAKEIVYSIPSQPLVVFDDAWLDQCSCWLGRINCS